MSITHWFLVLIGAVVVATAIGAVIGVCLAQLLPLEEGNRPSPPDVLRAREDARLQALEKIAARAARRGY